MFTKLLLLGLALCGFALAGRAGPAGWQAQHDQLIMRLRALSRMEGAFGPAYQPLYHAALP